MKQRRKRGQAKLEKNSCEICGFDNKNALNVHHIIPRCDNRCTNDNCNLAIVCHICHDLIHAGEITIIGVYETSCEKGRILLFFRQGEEPPLSYEYWRVKSNPFVIRGKRVS